ncbi:MAG TPA: hypothetical protein VK850_20405 [Candidatus Binatia bacterium]|nr:hypothetical protein [Candidatus Binatia bacterium]
MERPISTNALAQVQSALFKGDKIVAIKIYRQDTGSSLAEAKDAVDKLEAEWRTAFPEKFTAARRSKGCGGCVTVFIVLGALVLLVLLVMMRWAHAPKG